jgi:hypothetical protein
MGQIIRADHDPAYLEHAKRTARQLLDWATAFDDELY